MRAVLFTAMLSAAISAASGACAQDAGVFYKWLSPESPTCVPIAALKSIATVIDLTPEQFQFARALYIAIPPVSRSLPPGDRAIVAQAGDSAMIAIVDGDLSCARYLAPDFVQTMLMQVGEGENGVVGDAM